MSVAEFSEILKARAPRQGPAVTFSADELTKLESMKAAAEQRRKERYGESNS